MNVLRHAVASIVFFALLVSLLIIIYDQGLVENYGITEGDLRPGNFTEGREDQNIMEQFRDLNLIQGIVILEKEMMEKEPGSATLSDVGGTLIAVGTGILKVVIGLLVAPYSLTRIIIGYYAGDIPGIIIGLVAIIIVYAAFILLSAYLRHDV